jgi:CIC family chloride channel protein
VLFGVEKILGAAGGVSLGPFVVASIVAATAGRAIFGNHPVLAVPLQYGVRSAWELPLYALLGLITGVGAVVYSRTVWRVHDWFAPRARWIGILGGVVLVGGLDLYFRADLWGHGHQAVDLQTLAERPALLLFGLFAAKLVATAVTLAVGRAGGVFTPAIFLGATLGMGFGVLAVRIPGAAAYVSPGAFGVAGMAALVAGATHAPLTAIMMAFEMTGDYGLILPIMLGSTLAYLVARRLHPESIYTEWLVRRGIVFTHGADAAVLARNTVTDCLRSGVRALSPETPLAEIAELLRLSDQPGYPVVDPDHRLVGMISASELRTASAGAGSGGVTTASRLMQANPARVMVDDTLLTVLRRMAALEVEVLPVVERENHAQLVGIVTRGDVFRAYERALLLEHGDEA